jgi:HK97 gp10 family phage protein
VASTITGSIRLEGLKELETALKELPKATGKNVIRRTLILAAQPIADQARAMAPVGPPRPGELKKSIALSRIKFTGGEAGKAAFAQAMAEGATRAEAAEAAKAANIAASGEADITSAVIVIGPGRLVQAITQEFGTVHHPPQAYMRPAWDQNKMQALQIIKDELWNQIQKAAARLAKKAAKLAAST